MDKKPQMNINEMLGNIMGGMGDMSNTPWWKGYSYAEIPKFNGLGIINMAKAALFQRALMTDEVCYSYNIDWKQLDNKRFEKKPIDNFLKKIEAQKIYQSNLNTFYVFKNGAFELYEDGDMSIVDIVSLNKDDIDNFKKLLDTLFTAARADLDTYLTDKVKK